MGFRRADSIGRSRVKWRIERESGEIGRRTGFRFQRRKAWGFDSLLSHHRVNMINRTVFQDFKDF